jgi:hypothetical protein
MIRGRAAPSSRRLLAPFSMYKIEHTPWLQCTMYSDDDGRDLTSYKAYIDNDLNMLRKQHRARKIMIGNIPISADRLNSALHLAYRSGFTRTINYTIKQNPTVPIDWDCGLYGACEAGHIHLVRRAIARGATDFEGGLTSACCYGRYEVAKLMLSYTLPSSAAYSHACRKGHLDIVKLLLPARHPNVDICAGFLHACKRGHTQIVKLLIDAGAPRHLLHNRILAVANTPILKLLIENEYLINYTQLLLIHVGGLLDLGMPLSWFIEHAPKLTKTVNYEVRRLQKKMARCTAAINLPPVIVNIIVSYIEWDTL